MKKGINKSKTKTNKQGKKALKQTDSISMDLYCLFVSVMSVYHPELQELKINAVEWGKIIDCFMITMVYDKNNDNIIEKFLNEQIKTA